MEIPKKIKDRAAILRKTIDEYRYRYHVLDDPNITDESYDSLMEELRQLEKKYPQLKTPDSPTQRVGGEPLEKFQKVAHKKRQWSLDDAFTFEEIEEWEERTKKILIKEGIGSAVEYVVEIKIDGLKIILDYKNGKLIRGATRGDGRIGEDVTENIKTIQSLPLALNVPIEITVVGECWLSNKELKRINLNRKKEGQAQFANSRNAAAGSIRQLDPKIAASRRLDSFIYDVDYIRNQELVVGSQERKAISIPKTQLEELELLEKLRFKVNKNYKLCRNLNDIQKLYESWKSKKDQQEYGIDGLVVKVNSKKQQDVLGYTGKTPRFAIAWKFPAETTTTIVKDIKVQVGRTGALTPVALLRPVRVAGSVVSRATLHNADEIKKKDIRIGDTVVIQKAGDVIPEVVEVIKKMRSGDEKKFKMPAKCPICGGSIKREVILDKKKSQSAAHYCVNTKCFAIEKEKVIHFVSKKGFNIEGLGEKIVEQLIDEGLISSAADIFALTKGDLEPLERFAEKSADNLIEAISKSKRISMEKFFFALGIRHVGEESALLVKDFLFDPESCQLPVASCRLQEPVDLIKFFAKIEIEDLEKINGVGKIMAISISDWFNDPANVKSLQRLSASGVAFTKDEMTSNRTQKLKGKTLVLTGSLQKLTRDHAKDLIRKAGGNVASSVSSRTDYVVMGKDPGSKAEKAKKLGVKTINETQLHQLLS